MSVVVRVTVEVADIATTISSYDQIKILRSTTGQGGTYTEVSTAANRPRLESTESTYHFDDLYGDESYWYKRQYHNSETDTDDTASAEFKGSLELLYVSIQDVRDAGVLVGDASDAAVLSLIRTMQDFVDRATKNFFVPRNLTLDLDGRGSALLQVPVAIVALNELFLNDEFSAAADLTSFEVYDGRGGSDRDDRSNPRIKVKLDETSIFTGTGPVRRSTTVFEVGEKNQRLVGTFGYLEPDGSTPDPIHHATLKLVLQNVESVKYGGSAPAAGPIVEEETDRHRRKYADLFVGSKGFSKTGDPFLDQILAAYRGPWAMGSPRTQFRRLTGGQVL